MAMKAMEMDIEVATRKDTTKVPIALRLKATLQKSSATIRTWSNRMMAINQEATDVRREYPVSSCL